MKKPFLEIDVLTLFPQMFDGVFEHSLMARAQTAGLIKIQFHNLRDWSDDKRHSKIDDRSYGGGPGMVIRPEPLYQALKSLNAVRKSKNKPWVVYLSPQGKNLTQKTAGALSKRRRLVFICGHYEGIDERVMEWVDEEVSIGDFVLTGGEIPAMVVVDAVARLIPGVVGDPASIENESFSNGLLDYPHYTRPQVWRGREVPQTLLSGNHRKIAEWRKAASHRQTMTKRPEILGKI